jgi:hypothetical protein
LWQQDFVAEKNLAFSLANAKIFLATFAKASVFLLFYPNGPNGEYCFPFLKAVCGFSLS